MKQTKGARKIRNRLQNKKKYQKLQNQKTAAPKKTELTKKEYVKITIDYKVARYHGKGKQVDYTEETSEDYVLISYEGEFSETKRQRAIRRAYEQSIEYLNDLYCSNQKVDEVTNKSYQVTDQSTLNANSQNPQLIAMKKAVPIKYKFIKGASLNSGIEGMCTVQYLLDHLKKRIPTLTKNNVIEYILQKNRDANDPLREFITKDDWTNFPGLTCDQIEKFCIHPKIRMSHYALDITNKLFYKHVVKNSPVQPLIYYMMDSHMYPVVDKDTRSTIVRSSASENSSFYKKSSLYEKDDETACERFKLPSYENIPIAKLSNYKDCNIFMTKEIFMFSCL